MLNRRNRLNPRSLRDGLLCPPSLAFALVLSVGLLASCSRKDPADQFSPDDIAIAHAEPIDGVYERDYTPQPRRVKDGEPDAVPEKVAQSILSQLDQRGGSARDLAEGLRDCSAMHATGVSALKTACGDEYNEPTVECLRKEGHGQKSIGQILAARRFDLNGDGVPDYVIADRYYCNALSANNSNVYFIMLSDAKKGFHLGYADWATMNLLVVRHPKTEQLTVVEKSSKLYGTRTAIFDIRDNELVERICLREDDSGFSACTPH